MKLITMKTICIVSLLFLVISCKKDKDISIGTFSVDIAGTKTTFQVSAMASVLPVQNGFGIKITGYKKDPSASGTMLSLSIARSTSITPGTYTENIAGNPLVNINYSLDFFLGAVTSYINYHSTLNPATITITDISATSIKGTFQGELQGNFGGTILKTQVTNGVFYLSF